jgi:hypothetical protein
MAIVSQLYCDIRGDMYWLNTKVSEFTFISPMMGFHVFSEVLGSIKAENILTICVTVQYTRKSKHNISPFTTLLLFCSLLIPLHLHACSESIFPLSYLYFALNKHFYFTSSCLEATSSILCLLLLFWPKLYYLYFILPHAYSSIFF